MRNDSLDSPMNDCLVSLEVNEADCILTCIALSALKMFN
jgi:hypothetical protein